MKDAQVIELKSYEDMNNDKNISTLNVTPNNSRQINNIPKKTNLLFSSIEDFSSCDTLFGNNYIKYHLNNKFLSSKKCFHIRPKKMGNLYVYFFINDQPLFAIGNNRLSLVIIYELILQISFIVLMKTIIKDLLPYMKYMLISFYLNCFICHMFIYLINPGIPDIKYYSKIFIKSENYIKMKNEEKKNYYLCEICNIIVNSNDNIEHCEDCGICLKDTDHHCYWTGKCITKKNIWAFNFFSIGTLVYIVWYFIMIIFWIILQIAHYSSIKKKK